MKGFSDIIKAIRDSAHADEAYHSVAQNVGYAICGRWYPNTELFDKLEEAHEKELEDMRRDVADYAEEAKNFMVAQVVSRYNEQMEAIREECEQKVRAAIGKSPDANRIEHIRKEEYHRGYEDGLKARDVGMWQLEHERAIAVNKLLKVSLDTGGAMKKLSVALGCEWDSPRAQKSLFDLRARLIYLLSGFHLVGGSKLDSDIDVCKVNNLEDEPTLQKTSNFTNVDTIIELSNDYANIVAERNSILDLLKDAAKEYKELLDKYIAAPWEAMQSMDDEHMSRLGWMRALDRDGVPICMGDTVRYDEKGVPFVGESFEVAQITHYRDGSCHVSGGRLPVSVKSVQCTHQEPKPDPIEQVIRDLTLGNMSETEAIERLHEIVGS